MKPSIIVWDLETVPDLAGFAAAHDLVGKSEVEVREAMGDKFPKHIYHSIVCIGALIAHWESDHWAVDAVGAPHVGERTEKELITAYCHGAHAATTVHLVVRPYDIPYRCLTPQRDDATDLLVPVALSASHVAYSSVRMEPTWMMLGHAAGAAAAQAARRGIAVQDVDVIQLQEVLSR